MGVDAFVRVAHEGETMSFPNLPSTATGAGSPPVGSPNPLSSFDTEWIGAISSTPQVGSPPFRLNISPEELAKRYAELRAEMKKWREDDSGYDEANWPDIKAGLIANRGPEERGLFCD
jgi:hypothetical protein